MSRDPVHGRREEITAPARMVRVPVDHEMPVEAKMEVLGVKISWQWHWPPILIWWRVAPRRKFRVYEIRSQAHNRNRKEET